MDENATKMKYTADDCGSDATYHFTLVDKGKVHERHFCRAHAREYSSAYPWTTKLGRRAVSSHQGYSQFDLELVFFDEERQEHEIFLREAGSCRLFCFSTGPFEAQGIIHYAKAQPTPRPLTHQAVVNLLTGIGYGIQHATIYRFERRGTPAGSIYYAKIGVSNHDISYDADMRVSDALIFALIANVPLLIAEDVATIGCRQ
jgi:bifunctional DNase/RNase